MMQPLLSILIPITPDRWIDANNLLGSLEKQSWGSIELSLMRIEVKENIYASFNPTFEIEVISFEDNKEMTIGEKRERLYQLAHGTYSWQIDSDDDISDDAIELILEAIKQEPDCITFQEKCIINGVHFKSNHSLSYEDWEGDGQKEFPDGFHYHRTPFMKSVIKTEIARSVPIPHVRWSEDHQWSQALKPHLKTEVHIDKDIYFYQHISSSFNERYGIK